jgi:thiol-disulfide isomerase/thioredoxin
MNRRDIIRYITVFIITLALFLSATWLSSFLNNRKLDEVKTIQDKISIDILSSETQFQLLQELSCKDVSATSLSSELNDLAKKISFSEETIKNQDQVIELKKYYSLLQIKDYLLMEKIRSKCKVSIVPIFYFYTTEENCSDCVKQSAVLTELRSEYPELRVYSFDYNLKLSALQSLIKIFKVEDTKLPAVYMNEKLFTGFQSKDMILKTFPELEKYKQAREKVEIQASADNKLKD